MILTSSKFTEHIKKFPICFTNLKSEDCIVFRDLLKHAEDIQRHFTAGFIFLKS